MEKTVFAIAAMLILFGCTTQGGLPENAPAAAPYGQEGGDAAGQGNGADGRQGDGAGANAAPDENAGSVAGLPQAVQPGTPKYVATASVVQYSQEVRNSRAVSRSDIRRWDNISKAYGIHVGISDMENGMAPLKEAEKAAVHVVAPNGEKIILPYGKDLSAEYAKVPSQGYFLSFNPDYLNSAGSSFAVLENGKSLQGGTYTLFIDVEGDGEIDIEHKLSVPGTKITSPTYGQEMQPGGFNIEWEQEGSTMDSIYRISFGDGFAGLDYQIAADEGLPKSSLQITPELVDGTIEQGIYALNFQAENGMVGKMEGKAAILSSIVKEGHFISFKIGDFCHCEDIFLPSACTIDELQSDPLCQ